MPEKLPLCGNRILIGCELQRLSEVGVFLVNLSNGEVFCQNGSVGSYKVLLLGCLDRVRNYDLVRNYEFSAQLCI